MIRKLRQIFYNLKTKTNLNHKKKEEKNLKTKKQLQNFFYIFVDYIYWYGDIKEIKWD